MPPRFNWHQDGGRQNREIATTPRAPALGRRALGILERRQYQSSPPRHDYHLTDAGRELVPVIHAMRAWGDKWAVAEPPLRVEHHDHPIRTYVACATCGEPVRGDDLEFVSTVPDWDIVGPKRPAEAVSEESSVTTPSRRHPARQAGTNGGLTDKP
jgi:hypothetical protein